MKTCQFCAEEIQDAAVVCKHCGRDLAPGRTTSAPAPPQRVTVAGIDPFAAYHTDIQGKKPGKITIVGYLGIGLGMLILLMAVTTLPQSTDGGQSSFMLALFGVGVALASYFWVRR